MDEASREADAADQQAMQELDDAADETILACGGDMRETIKALIVLNNHLEGQLAQVSYGYARGKVGLQEAG